jgi:translation initiation factor IF-1
LRELRERRIIEEKEGEDMNIQPLNYKNKKYTVKFSRFEKTSRIAEGDYVKINTSRYDLTKEEIAKDIINSFKWADKYLRGEIEEKKANKNM